jgi:hypothetical protein
MAVSHARYLIAQEFFGGSRISNAETQVSMMRESIKREEGRGTEGECLLATFRALSYDLPEQNF